MSVKAQEVIVLFLLHSIWSTVQTAILKFSVYNASVYIVSINNIHKSKTELKQETGYHAVQSPHLLENEAQR